MTTRISRMVGFSVPPTMAEELDRVAEEERRTKSELFREMFRVYLTYRRIKRQQEDEERLDRLIQQVPEVPSMFPMIDAGNAEALPETARSVSPRARTTGIQTGKDADPLVATEKPRSKPFMT